MKNEKHSCRRTQGSSLFIGVGATLAALFLSLQAAGQGLTEVTLHAFGSAPFGNSPRAGVIEGSDGTLYGTTTEGGSFNYGAVFKITNPGSSPSLTLIYSFTGGSDGGGPRAAVIQASDGNLYGTTPFGGVNNRGTVFKIANPATTPTESVIYSFTGGSDGWAPYAALIQASDGNFYGTTSSGGSGGCGGSGCGAVFRITNPTSAPVESVIYSFSGGSDGVSPGASLIQASDGNLYGTTVGGGIGSCIGSTCGTVFKIANLSTSPSESVLYRFAGGSDGANPSSALMEASDGSFFGTTPDGGVSSFSCGAGCGTVYRITNPTTSPIESVIYSFTDGSDGGGPNASVIQLTDGNLYGTTASGGVGGVGCSACGTVFRITDPTTLPSESVVYLFQGGSDGSNPVSPLMFVSDGNLYGTTFGGGSNYCNGFSCGAVFKIVDPTGLPTESVIFGFSDSDGAAPVAPLIQTPDGNLWGTTSSGGSNFLGTVFMISTPESVPMENVVHSFIGVSDGNSPQAGLLLGLDGNLYGTTSSGGPGGLGTVFKISNPTTSPVESVIYGFVGGSDGRSPVASLLQASDGNLYGTTLFGGSSDRGTVFKISNPSTVPSESVIYSFMGGTDGANPRASLIEASDGSFYGTTSGGGASGNGTVFKIASPTVAPVESVVYSFNGGSDGADPEAAVTQASDGNLYGTTVFGGPANCFSLPCGTVFTISNPTTSPSESVVYAFRGPDGANPMAPLIQGSDGNLYGTTYTGGSSGSGGGTVFEILNPTTSPSESVVYSFSGGGTFPRASVFEAADGNLYGSISRYGAANGGTAFGLVACASSVPTASNNGPICAGQTLQLASSMVAGATYAWTGPNGFSSTLENPVIVSATIAASGSYSVRASVSGCISPPGVTVATVNPNPSAPTALNNGPICAGATLNLTASTLAGATYSWTGPNGFTSTLQNPSIANATTAATGTYSVTVTVSGCMSPAGTTTATVNPIPAAPTAGNNGPICAGATLNLTTPTVAGATYSWTGPNGFTSTLQNPSIANATTAATGTYSVTVTVSGCTSPAGTTTATVNAIPAAPTASNNGPICAGSTLNLTASTVAGATYSWTGPNGFTSALQNPSIANATTAATGTYSVTVTVSGCFSSAGTTTATVNANPTTPTITPTPTSVCASSTGNQASGPAGATSYAWTIGNGTITSAANIQTITYAAGASGTVTLNLTVTNASTCSASNSASVMINPNPDATITALAGVVANSTGNTASVPVTAGATYAWTILNGAITAGASTDTITFTAGASGTVDLSATVTITATGCSSTGNQSVTINPVGAVLRFFTISPCRLIDTRRPAGTYGGPALAGGTQRDFPIDGQCGIPADAYAVSANVTAVIPTVGGDLRAYPTGTPVPSSSIINFNPGRTRANNVLVPLTGIPTGSMTIQTDIPGGSTHFLFDVNGYFRFVSP